jgi:glycerate kinase
MSAVRSRGARYLVAPDSFKGTLAAPEVAAAIEAGLVAGGAGSVDVCPVADGGEGTMDLLAGAVGGRLLTRRVPDPLGRPREARFLLLEGAQTAIVEVAEASGLALVEPGERDPELATTAGTGELVAAAIAVGARRVLVAAGGSATTDGGAGAIEAIERAGGLHGAQVEVLCDVQTPFERAAIVYGPQKGADEAAVGRLTSRLERQAADLPRNPTGIPMTGCAGGLSGGLWAALGAELHAGAEYVFALLGVPARLSRCDAVVTGEGRLDSQSLSGKVVGALTDLCHEFGAELHVIAGASSIGHEDAQRLGISSLQLAGAPEEIRVAGGRIAANERAS